jgi:small-conductance mechanosensitive channel
MRKFVFIALITLFSVVLADNNVTEPTLEQQQRQQTLRILEAKLKEVDAKFDSNSIWLQSYGNYLLYLRVKEELQHLDDAILTLQNARQANRSLTKLNELRNRKTILENQITLLSNHSNSPFGSLLQPQIIEDIPEVSNPIALFNAFSFLKQLDEQKSEYANKAEELREITHLIREKQDILTSIQQLEPTELYREMLEKANHKQSIFTNAYEIVQTTFEVYTKRIDEVALTVNVAIKDQIKSIFFIGGILLTLFVLSVLVKLAVKKYISDNERFYMANKIVNMLLLIFTTVILVFSYIENVDYLVTVLGFASAGIAIAMKDWFMSVLGWMVIVVGGSLHVGDRIRVEKDGMIYVGDILDISFLRVTLLEDITLVTYDHNRRAGRIIFVPNNYVFTSLIASYTHFTLKTVWDGVDITVTFDSNHKKALHIAKEISRKYSKGYTDITRKQLNKLRDKYSLKNANVEPRIFTFIEENGVKITAWYLTSAYATLTLRSTISSEIVDAFNAEDDITIAFPTQRIHMEKYPKNRPPLPETLG